MHIGVQILVEAYLKVDDPIGVLDDGARIAREEELNIYSLFKNKNAIKTNQNWPIST